MKRILHLALPAVLAPLALGACLDERSGLLAPETSDPPARARIPEISIGGGPPAIDRYQFGPNPAVPKQAVITLAPGENIGGFNLRFGTTTVEPVPGTTSTVVKLPNGVDFGELSVEMIETEECDSAEPNWYSETPEGTQGTIPFYEGNHNFDDVRGQGAMMRVDAPAVPTTITGSGVVVAVLDTGIDATHPDLAGAVLNAGYDFIDDDADPSEERIGLDLDGDGNFDEGAGHGTHIAGIIHAIAPGAALLPVRVLDTEGWGTATTVAQGILFAHQAGADVINLSLGMYVKSEIIKQAIEQVADAGVIVVNAAGNRGEDDRDHFPARMSDVISVAATDENDARAAFSNYGPHITISAPGTEVLSTVSEQEGYALWDGTSMAAPIVTGAVALRLEHRPATTFSDLEAGFEATSSPITGEAGSLWDGKMGAGLLDVDGLVLGSY